MTAIDRHDLAEDPTPARNNGCVEQNDQRDDAITVDSQAIACECRWNPRSNRSALWQRLQRRAHHGRPRFDKADIRFDTDRHQQENIRRSDGEALERIDTAQRDSSPQRELGKSNEFV
jgi:hypothetical protein